MGEWVAREGSSCARTKEALKSDKMLQTSYNGEKSFFKGLSIDRIYFVCSLFSSPSIKSYSLNILFRDTQAARGRFRDLFTKEYALTTVGLWLLWFGTAFSYYGMVLAQSEILEFHKTCASGLSRADPNQLCYRMMASDVKKVKTKRKRYL